MIRPLPLQPLADDGTAAQKPTYHGIAIITGAGKRIGRAIALRLAQQGYAILAHGNTSGRAIREVVAFINDQGGYACGVLADLADPHAPAHIFEHARTMKQQAGAITVLINNASIFEYDHIHTATPAQWEQHQAVNSRAPFFLAQEFAKHLPEGQQGNIINLLDQRVWNLTPHFASYTISKAALWAQTQTLAMALAPHIRVNAIGPGPVLPAANQTQDHFDRQVAGTPLHRATPPEEIADAVLFLLRAYSMTGQMLAMDGGQHHNWAPPPPIQKN
jgi:NAD(P)-dependent dehydrogenase (short-subunit alcohol dehydrogenase family)